MIDFFEDVLVILSLILINSLFVISETAIIASRKSKLEALGKENSGARKALLLITQPEDFLSAVQVGITFTNMAIGIYGGVAITRAFADFLSSISYIGAYSEEISYFCVIAVMTYFTVLGEVIPKRVALLHPERIAALTSHAMSLFTVFAYPFVKSLTFATRFFLKVCNVQAPQSKISIEELRIMLNQAEFSSMLAKTEHDILRRIIHLSNTQVGAIMTPRNKVIWLNAQDSQLDNLQKIKMHEHHYFPVASGTLNSIIGIVPSKALMLDGCDMSKIVALAKDFRTVYIPETARVSKLLDFFREGKMRIALVIDEYGDIEGVVTLNDILKILVGDLAIGHGKLPDIINNSDGSYTVSGGILVEEVMNIMNVSSLPGDKNEDYRTLAGFVLNQMQSFPKVGDNLCAMGWSFKILKIEKRMIVQVLMRKESIA